jgi:hypothetical protein
MEEEVAIGSAAESPGKTAATETQTMSVFNLNFDEWTMRIWNLIFGKCL